MIQRTTQFPGPSTGNGAVVVLVDRRLAEFLLVQETILAALGHFRIPYRLHDLSVEPLSAAALEHCPAIVIGQENFGLRAAAADLAAILTAVLKGTGLVNFDARLDRYDKGFVEALGLGQGGRFESYGVTEIQVPDVSHYVTFTQNPATKHRPVLPVPAVRTVTGPEWDCLAQTNGGPALLARRLKAGRVVQWLVSPQLWTLQFFGHAHGLDDLFWKAIVWAARKPFAMMPLPPFVRFRLDDCNGLYRDATDLKFLEVFNRFGHKPNVSVCLSALKDEGWTELKRLQDANKVEVAPHIWAPGTSLFFGDRAGEYSEERLKQIIADTKELFARHGVKPSAVLSDHVHEYSTRVLPYLGELGIEFKMNVTAPGEAWDGKHLDWAPAPYGSLSYSIDYIPGPYPLFVVFNHYPAFDFIRIKIDQTHWVVNRGGGVGPYKWDFLNGLTKSVAGTNDIEAIAERLAEHTRLGLNSLFFGGSISHSHFAADLCLGEWDAVLARYEALTERLPKANVGYDDLAFYVRSRHHTFIDRVDVGSGVGDSSVRLTGHADIALKLTVFSERDAAVEGRVIEVPSFAGISDVRF